MSTGHTPVASELLRARLAAKDRPLRLLETHDGLSARLAETAGAVRDGVEVGFDGVWISSLADSASRAQPDHELIDLGTRLSALEWVLQATELPAVFDADTGGRPEQVGLLVRRLARIGVAAVVFEDKAGAKRNSLALDRLSQTGATEEDFCRKLRVAKEAAGDSGPFIVGRIESLIRGDGVDDLLSRAHAYVAAGADALLIHGPGPTAQPVLDAVRLCRQEGLEAPIFVVPTAFPEVQEHELASAGVDVVIYANHPIRAALLAMRRCAAALLEGGCAQATEELCVPVQELLEFIGPGGRRPS